MRMYIISWLGDDTSRETRLNIHERQIEWGLDKGLDVVVNSMEYEPSEYNDNVRYIGDDKLRPPGESRNILLEDFYKSSDDYCILADNDSVFRDISEFDFLSSFHDQMDDILKQPLGVITPLNSVRLPFNKEYNSKKEWYDGNMVFEKLTHSKGSLFIVKNFKKFGLEPLYFDSAFTDENGKMIPEEDVEFGLHSIIKGYGCYFSRNIVLKENGPSTWAKDNSSRHDTAGSEIILNKHGIPYSNNLNDDVTDVICYKTSDKQIRYKAFSRVDLANNEEKKLGDRFIDRWSLDFASEVCCLDDMDDKPDAFKGVNLKDELFKIRRAPSDHPKVANMEKYVTIPLR